MATIQVRARFGATISVVAAIRKGIAGGTTSIDRTGRRGIARQIARHNEISFRGKTRRREWRRISLWNAVFSSKVDRLLAQVGNVPSIIRRVGAIDPLLDTGTLFESLTNPSHEKFRVVFTKFRIRYETAVRYAPKHVNGATAPFRLGAVEKRRLKERVPPPRKDGKVGRKRGRGLITRGKPLRIRGGGKGRGDRAHYKILGAAKKRYPTSARIPIRSWITEMGRSQAARIEAIINDRVIRTNIQAASRLESRQSSLIAQNIQRTIPGRSARQRGSFED